MQTKTKELTFSSRKDALKWVYDNKNYSEQLQRQHAARIFTDTHIDKFQKPFKVKSWFGFDLVLIINVTMDDLRHDLKKILMHRATVQPKYSVVDKLTNTQVVKMWNNHF